MISFSQNLVYFFSKERR